MSAPNREEVDAKLDTVEARMDGRGAAIAAKIDNVVNLLGELAKRTDARFERVEAALAEIQTGLKNLKTTVVVTAITSVLTIVIGVAAFNATVLPNMVAAFESGKSTASAQAEVKRQIEETDALLRQIQKNLKQAAPAAQPAPPSKS